MLWDEKVEMIELLNQNDYDNLNIFLEKNIANFHIQDLSMFINGLEIIKENLDKIKEHLNSIIKLYELYREDFNLIDTIRFDLLIMYLNTEN